MLLLLLRDCQSLRIKDFQSLRIKGFGSAGDGWLTAALSWSVTTFANRGPPLPRPRPRK